MKLSYLAALVLLPIMLGLAACASAAPPDAVSGESPGGAAELVVGQQQEPTAEPTPELTSTPEPTPEPTSTPEPEEEGDGGGRQTQHVYGGVASTASPPTPLTPHGQGLEGCKKIGLFDDNDNSQDRDWCSQQLPGHVHDQCSGRATAEEQLACGTAIVSEYQSVFFRDGYARCAGITTTGDIAVGCSEQAADNINKAFGGIFDAWPKVQTVGNRDPEVVKAWEATITCLEDKGFKDINRELLFPWQNLDRPNTHLAKEEALTGPDKDLRERLTEPSRDCAKQEGLFAAQDTAWAAELRRLHDEEPDTVDALVREGLLANLEKPGVSEHISGDNN